jgi:hypothetical protein
VGQAFVYGQSYGRQLVVRNGLQGLRVAFLIATNRTSFFEVDSSGDIPIGEWTHLVGTYDNSALRLFVNGALDQQATVNITPWDSGCPFHIGGTYDTSGSCAYSGQFFNGLIDEVACYDQALAASDVQALYNAGEAGKCNSLGYWLEYYFGTNCWNQTYAAAGTDADGDGVLNIQEYWNHTDPNKIQFSLDVTNEYVTTTTVPLQLSILGGLPSYVAWMINDTDTTHASWQTYTGTNLNVTIGTADGSYTVWVGLKGLPADAQQSWDGLKMTLDRAAPVLSITNPILTGAAATVAKPYLQLAGWANEPLSAVTYDLVNAAGTTTNLPGFVTDQFFDTNSVNYTTSYFQCFDIPLTNGDNAIALHATDLAGHVTTTNITATLDYSAATPPVVSLVWPPVGIALSGPTFYVRGRVSDETASVAAEVVDAGGNTIVVDGNVERNSVFWVEDLPLAAGASTVTLTVTNAAGSVTTTNLVVTQSAVTLTITSTPSDESLYQATGSVSGNVSDANYAVAVNGIPATVYGSGYWVAESVPIRGQGTATFDAVASSGASSVAASAAVEMPAYLAIVDYFDMKYANHDDAGPPSSSSTYTRAKHVTATYQADPSGAWTSAYHGVATDHEAYSPSGSWYHFVYDWSNAGKTTHETTSEGFDGTWDGISENYHQITGLPDQDLSCSAPGGGQPWWIYHYYASGVQYRWSPAKGSTDEVGVCARTRQKLFTGGKAIVNRQNLLHINAWAQQYGKPPLAPWQGTPADFIDPAKIQMLGHSLAGRQADGSGDLYLVMPDNAALDLNLSIPGVKHYNATVTSVQKHKLFVQANSYLLAPDCVRPDAHYCVGQGLTFTPAFVPEIPNVSEKRVQWMLPGKFVNYTTPPSYPDGSSNYVINLDLLATETTIAWWFNAAFVPQKLAVMVRVNLTFGNGQLASVPACGQLTMHRPRLVNFTKNVDGPVALNLVHNHAAGNSPYLEGPLQDALAVGPPAHYTVYVEAIAPFSGLAGSTQTVSGREGTDWSMGVDTHGNPYLDTQEFYVPPYPLNEQNGYRRRIWIVDTPGTSMGALSTWATVQLDFEDYIRFKPDAGPGPNIYVTLGSVDWHVHGETSLGLGPAPGDVVDWCPVATGDDVPQMIPTGEAGMDDLVNGVDYFPYWLHTGQGN